MGIQRVNPVPDWSYTNIAAAATTVVKKGAGNFHGITVNTLVVSATITIYDDVSAVAGRKIATITLESTITGSNPFQILYDVAFSTGLTIVTSGATDLTVEWV